MRVMFVYWPYSNAGSATDLAQYSRVARALGHEAVVYGPKDARLPFECDLDVANSDLVVFVLEWNPYLHHGGSLNLLRLLAESKRSRRIVVDCDGMYNDALHTEGDCNHLSAEASACRTSLCDAISDDIFQPTYHPLRRNVRSFLFHAYPVGDERPLDDAYKTFGMMYVGSCWFRWRPLERVLRAIEPIRTKVGRIALVGAGWDKAPATIKTNMPHDAYYFEPDYIRKLGVEVYPPVPFQDVLGWMGKAIFNPVIYRPLFSRLRFVTCRTFETIAANTIPLFAQDETFVREVYGDAGLALMLGEDPRSKIVDVVDRPGEYWGAVQAVRRHLTTFHSYEARFRQLLALTEPDGVVPQES